MSIPGAFASSITNRDGSDHKVRVIEGNAAADHVLQPSATLKGICNSGCVVRLNDNPKDEYQLQGSDVVSIEDGYLYYDGPPASAVPKAGDADRPSEPAPE
ncbi:MAG TPA: hypothetical protein VNR51_00625 [Hyphomicrobium sp.]|nr:hypothetical protein [Hyphomicrobium sp.]